MMTANDGLVNNSQICWVENKATEVRQDESVGANKIWSVFLCDLFCIVNTQICWKVVHCFFSIFMVDTALHPGLRRKNWDYLASMGWISNMVIPVMNGE